MAKDAFDKNWETSRFKGVLLRRSSNLAKASGSDSSITWQVSTYDTQGFWSSSTNPTRITIRPGINYVRVYANVEISGTDANRSFLYVRKNNANFHGMAASTTTVESGNTITTTISSPIPVEENDYFEARFVQNSGGSRNIVAGETTWFGLEAM